MRRHHLIRVALALTLALAVAGVRMAHGDEIIDRVLAVVRGDIILLSDLRAARDLGLAPAPSSGDVDRAILSALIDRALMLDEVSRYAPPEPPAADVDRAFDEVRRRQSADRLAAAFSRSGLDERQLRERLRQDLRIRAYVAQRFGDDAANRAAVDDWLAGLRRRGGVIDLYRSPATTP